MVAHSRAGEPRLVGAQNSALKNLWTQPPIESSIGSKVLATQVELIHSTMTSRSFTLRMPLHRLFTRPLSQRRTLISAGGYVKAHGIVPRKPLGSSSLLFSRGMKTIDFAGHKETVYGKHTPIGNTRAKLIEWQSARIGLVTSYWCASTSYLVALNHGIRGRLSARELTE